MDQHIRVLVADRLKVMREVIIATFAEEPDIEVVGEVSDESDILPRMRETQPDVLFIGLDDPQERPALFDTVFRLHPRITIIAIGAHSNRSVRYWVSYEIHSTIIESSERAILAAVRSRTALAGEAS